MGDLQRQVFIESLPFHIGWIIVLLVGAYIIYTQFIWDGEKSIDEKHIRATLSILLVIFVGFLSTFINIYLMNHIFKFVAPTTVIIFRGISNSIIPLVLSIIISIIIILINLYKLKTRSIN